MLSDIIIYNGENIIDYKYEIEELIEEEDEI